MPPSTTAQNGCTLPAQQTVALCILGQVRSLDHHSNKGEDLSIAAETLGEFSGLPVYPVSQSVLCLCFSLVVVRIL
jgi:hypothetical protein